MEANYAGAVAKLREVLDKLDPADPILAAKEEVLGKYGPLFRPERVQKITAEEFVSFLQPENNRHWSGLQRQASAITADMEALRHGLALLVDESQPLAPRFTRALQSVRGLGPAIASAILLVAYPDRYGVWNRISESALKKLGIWPSVPRGATKGEIYQRINELLLRLHDDLGVDLWTLDLILWRVVSDQPSPAVTPDLARWFAEEMKKPDYVQRERHYKVAVHLIVRRLLSPASLEAPNFPGLLAKFFQGQLEPEELGLNADEAVEVRQKLTSSGLQLFEAIVSLAGGRWGVNQMTWIPRAVERGFGEELRAAFRTLVDDDLSLDDRVDAFREALEVVQARLRDAGGFEPHWRIVTPSHPFVGMILGAYDPHQYTFYHAGAFKQAFERLGVSWPAASGGRLYQEVCKLVQLTQQALQEAGVPVRDMIDAQSFLYLLGTRKGKEANGEITQVKRLADFLLWPEERAARLLDLAARGKPLLFAGPPGTGKTCAARKLAQLWATDDDHIEVVQFHPSYAYEDFIEGIRPRIGEGGGVRYEIVPGVLKALCQLAANDPEARFVLIIDEINRANLPRVLGEVLYCVEYRGKDGAIRLPYSGEEFWIPENLLIIGTMNTADRSIAIVDAALRRRFLEIRFDPDPEVLRRWWEKQGDPATGEKAARKLVALNHALQELLDAHRLVGHTYLMDPKIAQEGFEPVWDWQLRPVLAEHLYARPEEVDRLREVFLNA